MEIGICRKKTMHPSVYIQALLETCAEFLLLFYPSHNRRGNLSLGKAKALFQYHIFQRKWEWNITVGVILLPYASSQTYACDYFNCKKMTASPELRRKEIPFAPNCLEVWVHVSRGPQHFQELGHTYCDGQLACLPLSLRAGVTAVAEDSTCVPRKPLPGAFTAIPKGLQLSSGFSWRPALSLQLSKHDTGIMYEGKHLLR